jgi:hypothetical protein
VFSKGLSRTKLLIITDCGIEKTVIYMVWNGRKSLAVSPIVNRRRAGEEILEHWPGFV